MNSICVGPMAPMLSGGAKLSTSADDDSPVKLSCTLCGVFGCAGRAPRRVCGRAPRPDSSAGSGQLADGGESGLGRRGCSGISCSGIGVFSGGAGRAMIAPTDSVMPVPPLCGVG